MDPDVDTERDVRHMTALVPLLVEQRRFEKARWKGSDQLNIWPTKAADFVQYWPNITVFTNTVSTKK